MPKTDTAISQFEDTAIGGLGDLIFKAIDESISYLLPSPEDLLTQVLLAAISTISLVVLVRRARKHS